MDATGRAHAVRLITRQADTGTIRMAAGSAAPRQFDAPSSSTIRGAAYDPDTQHLTVTFVSGATYEYDGVPAETWARFHDAPSKGAFFGTHIRPHHRHSRKT